MGGGGAVVADNAEQVTSYIREHVEEFPDAELKRALAKSNELCMQTFAAAEPDRENHTQVFGLSGTGVCVMGGEGDGFGDISEVLYLIERSDWDIVDVGEGGGMPGSPRVFASPEVQVAEGVALAETMWALLLQFSDDDSETAQPEHTKSE